MNKSIQDQLNAIINGGSVEPASDKSLLKSTKTAFDYGDSIGVSSDLKSEISSYFKPPVGARDKKVSEVDQELMDFKEKKARKEKVMKDVEKFIASLPSEQAQVLNAKLTKKPEAPKVPVQEEEEPEEEIKVREINKEYLIKMCGQEDFSQVQELNLKQQKIHKMQHFDRFVGLKKLVLDGNKLTRIQGMKHLRQLEELSMRNNCLDSIQGIEF